MSSEAYYRIADVVLRVECDFVFPAQGGYMRDFLVEPCAPDYTLRFCRTDSIPAFQAQYPLHVGEIAKFHYYQNRGGKRRASTSTTATITPSRCWGRTAASAAM